MYEESPHHHLLPDFSPLFRMRSLEKVREEIVYSRRLERMWAFVEYSYTDPNVRLADAAKHSGISRDHLNFLLHRFANTTFHDLLTRYRVEKCLELLHDKNYSLTEVYYRCGFSSPATFDRQFKKWVGCSASEYKKLLRSFHQMKENVNS